MSVEALVCVSLCVSFNLDAGSIAYVLVDEGSIVAG